MQVLLQIMCENKCRVDWPIRRQLGMLPSGRSTKCLSSFYPVDNSESQDLAFQFDLGRIVQLNLTPTDLSVSVWTKTNNVCNFWTKAIFLWFCVLSSLLNTTRIPLLMLLVQLIIQLHATKQLLLIILQLLLSNYY